MCFGQKTCDFAPWTKTTLSESGYQCSRTSSLLMISCQAAKSCTRSLKINFKIRIIRMTQNCNQLWVFLKSVQVHMEPTVNSSSTIFSKPWLICHSQATWSICFGRVPNNRAFFQGQRKNCRVQNSGQWITNYSRIKPVRTTRWMGCS